MKIADAISGYIKLRDAKEELAKKQKEEMKPYNEKLAKIEAWLMKKFLEEGVTQQKGKDGGIAFIQSNDSCKVVDQQAFMDFVKENNAFELMDVRASKTVVRDFMENQGEIPPGISYTQSDVIRVRR